MITILVEKEIKVEKSDDEVEVEIIEDDTEPPEDMKNSTSPQAKKSPLHSNIHSSIV